MQIVLAYNDHRRIYIPENKVQDKAGNVLDVVVLKMQETKSQKNKAGGFQLKTFFSVDKYQFSFFCSECNYSPKANFKHLHIQFNTHSKNTTLLIN